MHCPIPNLSDYGLHPSTGFLPPSPPLSELPGLYYAPWESIISKLPNLISTKQIRDIVHSLPVLSTSHLKTEPEYQRAYSLLCFLSNAYIWSDKPAADRLPAALSIPLLEVCGYLGMLPTITYAALCLWNYRPLQHQSLCLDNPGTLSALHTFTGTEDESWFYVVSVAIEARGAPIIPHLLHAIDAARNSDIDALVLCLESVAEIIGELEVLLKRMYERLAPRQFYGAIRPYLAGSRDLPKGLVYETGSADGNKTWEEEKYHMYGGGSVAQGSLFQFVDAVLGIQHGEQMREFVQEMRRYMPGAHRRLLEDVEAVENVKGFVKENGHENLGIAYGRCVGKVKGFRNGHIGVVTRYIVIPSKASVKRSVGEEGRKESTGTAGAPLIPFLKQMRDETV